RRQRIQHVEPAGAGVPERVLDVGQLALEEESQPGHEVVRLPELRDALALPATPRLLRGAGRRLGVALDDGHRVTIARQQQRHAEPAHASADDENVRQRGPPANASHVGTDGSSTAYRFSRTSKRRPLAPSPRRKPPGGYLVRRLERERLDFFAGTLAPARRASERPIAIACFRLLTFLPERPDLSVPAFRSRIAFSTLAEAFLPYARAMQRS